jgi:hypothetical protein
MVYMWNGVETRSMMAHDRTSGWWEWRGLMGHDEVGDMGHLVPMKKEV